MGLTSDPCVTPGAAAETTASCKGQESCTACLTAHADCAWCKTERSSVSVPKVSRRTGVPGSDLEGNWEAGKNEEGRNPLAEGVQILAVSITVAF